MLARGSSGFRRTRGQQSATLSASDTGRRSDRVLSTWGWVGKVQHCARSHVDDEGPIVGVQDKRLWKPEATVRPDFFRCHVAHRRPAEPRSCSSPALDGPRLWIVESQPNRAALKIDSKRTLSYRSCQMTHAGTIPIRPPELPAGAG